MPLTPAMAPPSTGSGRVQSDTVTRTDLAAAPIPQADILAGAPLARSRAMSVSPDGDLRSFLWECTAGRFRWDFTVDEVVHILDGEVTIEADGREALTLSTGSTAYFPHGTSTIWNVPVYVRKFATTRDPATDPASRGVRWAKRKTAPLRARLRTGRRFAG